MSVSYWMIEKGLNGVAHWWTRNPGQNEYWDLPSRWTTDSTKARHYESKLKALRVMGVDMFGCTATEHIDHIEPPTATPQGKI